MEKKRKGNPASLRWTLADVTQSVLASWSEIYQFNIDDLSQLVHQPQPNPVGLSPEQFRTLYWQAETWSKYPFDIGIDRKEVAIASFFEYETRCADTNRRLCDLESRPIPERYRAWLRRARGLMAHLFEGFSLDEVVQHCKWGPGASTSMSRLNASPQNKWVKAAHITRPALPYLFAFQNWCGREFSAPVVVEGNKVVTVPKNSKTDRTIAIEPDWNMFFQLGFGGSIRRRLQRTFGLLKRDAQEFNQRLARMGSVDGFLATVDLKGASDSLSLALVEYLVPPDVYQHLFALRSPHGVLSDGRCVTYEKISSMGNGYTFELETAVFYCLVRACSGHARAYGDDLIVASSTVSQVADFLAFCGFELNGKKTHYDSPFRESCGGHYHSGVDVTPVYVRKPLTGPARLTFCNRLSELCDNGHWREGSLKALWDTCAKGVPRFLYGPRGVPGTLHTSFSEARPNYSKRYQTFTGTKLLESRRFGDSSPDGGLLQSLWIDAEESSWRSSDIEIKSQKPVLSYRTWWMGWSDVSPWCVV